MVRDSENILHVIYLLYFVHNHSAVFAFLSSYYMGS